MKGPSSHINLEMKNEVRLDWVATYTSLVNKADTGK